MISSWRLAHMCKRLQPLVAIWAAQSLVLYRYTKDGLTGIDTLKNRDRALATVLQRVAKEGNMEVYLASITKSESGACDPEDETMVDVCDSECTIEDWISFDGSEPDLVSDCFTMDEIFQVRQSKCGTVVIQGACKGLGRHLYEWHRPQPARILLSRTLCSPTPHAWQEGVNLTLTSHTSCIRN